MADSHAYGEISYLIEIWRKQNGMIHTEGIIETKSETIGRLHRTEELLLTLETGETVPIIITNIDAGQADIRIIGPVAGLAR